MSHRPFSAFPRSAQVLEAKTLLSAVIVSTEGSDAAGDGSLGSPFATLAHAVANTPAGGTIRLREGTYDGGVTVREPDLTIESYPGERATLTAPTSDPDVQQVVRFHFSADRGTLRNLEITGGYYYGVKTESNWDWGVPDDQREGVYGLTIEGCVIHHTGRDAIKLTPGADDALIRGNTIHHTGVRYAGNAEGIDVVNGDRLRVLGNHIHDTATNGVYAKGGSVDPLIEANLIERTGSLGVAIGYYTDVEWFDEAANPELFETVRAVVRNNVIRDTAHAGIGFYGSLDAFAHNNTLFNVATAAQAAVITAHVDHYVTSTEFIPRDNVNPRLWNNVIVGAAGADTDTAYLRAGSVSGPVDFASNLWWDLDLNADGTPRTNFVSRVHDPSAWRGTLAEWKATVGETGSVEADAMLGADLHLLAGSPAIDFGLPTFNLADDYDGDPRADAPDAGADEFGGYSLPVPPTAAAGTGREFAQPPQPAVISLQQDAFVSSESDGSLFVAVSRTGGLDRPASATLSTVGGTATLGEDVPAVEEVVTFAAGETLAFVEIPIVDDSVYEGEESFGLTLGGVSAGDELGAIAAATVQLFDNDPPPQPPPTVSLTETRRVVREDDGTLAFTVVRTGDATKDAKFYLRTIGTDGLGGRGAGRNDRQITRGWFTIPAGQTSLDVTVDLYDDELAEFDEFFRVQLVRGTAGTILGDLVETTVQIVDDEKRVRFIPTRYDAAEGGPSVQTTLMRTGDLSDPLSVRVRTVAKTASEADYVPFDRTVTFAAGQAIETLPVAVVNDAEEEATERFILKLSDISDPETLSPRQIAHVYIADNDPEPPPGPPTISVAETAVRVREGDGNVAVRVERTGDLSAAASVSYVIRGTGEHPAYPRSDWLAADAALSFAPGQSEAVVEVELLDDAVAEFDETFRVTLYSPDGADLGESETIVTIGDNESTLGFAVWQVSAAEGGTAVYRAERRGDASFAASAAYATVDQTAAAGEDYEAASGTLSFAAGERFADIEVRILDDLIADAGETFGIVLSDLAGGGEFARTFGQVVIEE